MNKSIFLKEFKTLLPDSINETSINESNIETSTLLYIGYILSNMTKESDNWYFNSVIDIDELLIDIIAKKYKIEW
jgi:hypothetical protein